MPLHTCTSLLDHIWQGFSNFFSEGPDETPVQPERAKTVFGGAGQNDEREA